MPPPPVKLAYKNAAAARPSAHPAAPLIPLTTPLTSRTMSASCIPSSPSSPSTHICPRCAPPPPGSTLPTPVLSAASPTTIPASAPPSSPASLQSSPHTSHHSHAPPPSPFVASPPRRTFHTRPRLLSRRHHRPDHSSFKHHPPTSSPPPPPRPSRAVYNATTASARAAALAAAAKSSAGYLTDSLRPSSRSKDQVIHRISRPPSSPVLSRLNTFPGSHPTNNPPSALTSDEDTFAHRNLSRRRTTRVVVQRRVIRGSSVFRPATEDDIDEYLQIERFRQMMPCPTTAIDIPPFLPDARPLPMSMSTDPDPMLALEPISPAKRALSRRGVRRMSSLLSKHLGLDPEHITSSSPSPTLDLSEFAVMDEYKAVALFLAEIRRYRKEIFYTLHNKTSRHPDKLSSPPMTRRRDSTKRNISKEKRFPIRTDSDSHQHQSSHQHSKLSRSISADDPVVMRQVLQRERMAALVIPTSINTQDEDKPCAHDQRSHIRPDTDHDDETTVDSGPQPDVLGRFRSRSDIIAQRMTWKSRGYGHGGGGGGGGDTNIFDEDVLRDDVGLRSLRGNAELRDDAATDNEEHVRQDEAPRSQSPQPRDGSMMEDEEDGNRLRILTAIEPMNLGSGVDEAEARRGTSYHTGVDGSIGRLRRGPLLRLSRGKNETGLLRRLRSFRNKRGDGGDV